MVLMDLVNVDVADELVPAMTAAAEATVPNQAHCWKQAPLQMLFGIASHGPFSMPKKGPMSSLCT